MALSTKVNKALAALSNVAREVQRSGTPNAVMTSRKLLSSSDALRDELESLTRERDQAKAELASVKAQLEGEITELTQRLENEWPVPASPEPLPPDYWETAQ